MSLSGIKWFCKPHGSGKNGGSSSTTIINGGTSNNYNVDSLNINGLNAVNADIEKLTASNANINNAQFQYLMSPEGVITKISGESLDYTNGNIKDIKSDNIVTEKVTVNDMANINKLIADYIQSNNITTDYLTVNKSAHFFELIIDKIRSIQGTQMNTAANCVADYVEAYDSSDNLVHLDANNVAYYRIYWKNTDNDGRAVTNDWMQNDQAICESFNVDTGTNYNTSNKYYWRLVDGTSNDTGQTIRYVNFANIEDSNGNPTYYTGNSNAAYVGTSVPSIFEIHFANFGYGDATDKYTSFNVTSQITGEWDDTNDIFTPSSTLYGIQIVAADDAILSNGHFYFTTTEYTRLNVGVYYTDGSFAYFPASDAYIQSYDITCSTDNNVEAFVITTAVIDKWDACNWIDLSNITKDASLSGKSEIPSIGDNICQLGYRYGVSPTQDKKARASAIIIAAYATPDDGDLSATPPIPAVVPPSYAQYQDITDFDLATHRGSYFDATGAYITGKFKVVNGNTTIDLDQYIQMQVGETGIVIEDGKIVLNADTAIVNGSLDIYDDNCGLTLYNSDGQIKTQIVTRNVSSISNNNFIHVCTTSGRISNNTVTLIYNLGLINTGTNISIDQQSIEVTNDITTTLHPAGDYIVSIIDENDNVLVTNSITNAQIENGGCDIANYTFSGSNQQLRLQLSATLGNRENWKLTWQFTETVTADAYNIIGRDGMLITNTNNRIFRIDNNEMTIQSNDDAISFIPRNLGDTQTPILRRGWNGNSEFWLPYDNYERTIRLVDVGSAVHYNDRELARGGSYNINYNEAGTYIFSVHAGAATTYNIYLPSSGSFMSIPGYKVKIVFNGWCSKTSLGVAKHTLGINVASGSGDTILHGTSYESRVNTNNFKVNEFMWTGDSWVDTNELT